MVDEPGPPPREPPPTPWLLEAPPDDHPDDLWAVGADLEPGTLLAAYRLGLFPMPVGPRLGWFSPARRGRGPARAVLAVTVAPASRAEVRDPRRHRVRRRPRRLCAAGRADELDRRHRRRGVRAGSTSSAGRTRSRRGTRRGWPAASTASRSAASSPPSRCSTRARTRRRPPSSASCDDSARRATRIGACSTSSGSPPTSPPSAPWRSGEPSTGRRLADARVAAAVSAFLTPCVRTGARCRSRGRSRRAGGRARSRPPRPARRPLGARRVRGCPPRSRRRCGPRRGEAAARG